jgi:hypothetical protein
MKRKPTSLSLVDLDECTHPTLRSLFDRLASRNPSQMMRLGDVNGLKNAIVLHDWRQVAVRYLRRHARKFDPNIWIYRGGNHVAIHVERVTTDDFGNEIRFGSSFAHPSPCLARIIEQ